MSQYYDADRAAMRAILVESRRLPPPSNATLTRMMPACRDETFRRAMELAFEGPRRSRFKTICDIASEMPWAPTEERSTHDGVVGKVFMGVGIIAGLGLACYAVKRQYQVRQIAGQKRKREEDDEAEIGIPKAAEDELEMAPAPQTPPPWPSASTDSLLNLIPPPPLQDIMALAIAGQPDAEDGVGPEATDSADKRDIEDSDDDDEEEGMSEEGDGEEAEADVAESDEEDGSDDDDDGEDKVHPPATTTTPVSDRLRALIPLAPSPPLQGPLKFD